MITCAKCLTKLENVESYYFRDKVYCNNCCPWEEVKTNHPSQKTMMIIKRTQSCPTYTNELEQANIFYDKDDGVEDSEGSDIDSDNSEHFKLFSLIPSSLLKLINNKLIKV
tara:strand:+ start:2577 stop:2909 length:333 start_codon:yes stop_codon:yes gene_type:complete